MAASGGSTGKPLERHAPVEHQGTTCEKRRMAASGGSTGKPLERHAGERRCLWVAFPKNLNKPVGKAKPAMILCDPYVDAILCQLVYAYGDVVMPSNAATGLHADVDRDNH
jgi:hypothetical protein